MPTSGRLRSIARAARAALATQGAVLTAEDLARGVLALERRQDITLIKAVARAFRWRRSRGDSIRTSPSPHKSQTTSSPTPPTCCG